VSTTVDTDRGLELLRAMVEIRAFEDAVLRLFLSGEVPGTTHLCQGQEAIVVGACEALRSDDVLTCTYRGHGAVLAKGAALEACFAEILGRRGGLCGGKGGSMHLTDAGVGALGSFAVIGAGIPVAAGAALAAVMQETDRVAITFFGDGTTNIGAFHEAMNLAAIWKLPLILVCENNLYGEYSPLATTTPIERLADRAAAYAMPGVRIDGNDVFAVRDAVAEAAARGRAGEGPTFIEAMTYRHSGHSRSDPATYRPEGELEEWLQRDPIELLRARLAEDGVGEESIESAREAGLAAVAAAREAALASPLPEPSVLFADVYAGPAPETLSPGQVG
jgi:pyruvate dehydrogenase E1 component alpha subunit